MVAAALAAGCASTPVGNGAGIATRGETEGLPSETGQAAALAYFAQGLIHEWDESPDLEAALASYREALKQNPSDSELWNLVARMLMELERMDEAQSLLSEAQQALPLSGVLRFSAGRVRMARSEPAAAAVEFEAAVALAPTPIERIDALLHATFAHFSASNDTAAVAMLSHMAAMPDSLADAEGQGDYIYTPRIRAIRFALELDELCMDNPDAARPSAYAEWATSVASNRVELADIWERHALAALRKVHLETAGAAFSKVVEAQPWRSMPLLIAIAIKRNMPSDKVGLREVQEEIARDPTNTGLRMAAAHMLNRQGRSAESVDQARSAMREYTAQHPGESTPSEIWMLLGNALESNSQRGEAIQVFEACLKQHPDFAPAQNYLAYIWAETGQRLEEAERLVTAALRSEPENYAYLDTLGWVYYQQGRYEDALVWLMRATEGSDRDPTIFDHIGDTLAKLGRESESTPFWSMSYWLEPENTEVAEKLKRGGVDLAKVRPPASALAEGEREDSAAQRNRQRDSSARPWRMLEEILNFFDW